MGCATSRLGKKEDNNGNLSDAPKMQVVPRITVNKAESLLSQLSSPSILSSKDERFSSIALNETTLEKTSATYTDSPIHSSPSDNAINSTIKKNSGEDDENQTITIRLSTTSKDIKINVSKHEPFMSVSDLQKEIRKRKEEKIKPNQNIRLIYLGQVLSDSFYLVPSTTMTSSFTKSNSVKVYSGSVIQAMIS